MLRDTYDGLKPFPGFRKRIYAHLLYQEFLIPNKIFSKAKSTDPELKLHKTPPDKEMDNLRFIST